MPGYSVTAANQALDSLAGGTTNVLAFVNLAATDPGTTGAAEAGSTRQACSWNAASARSKTNSSVLSFTGQGTGSVMAFFRTDSAFSAGTFGVSGALGSNVTAATITIAAAGITISA